MGGCISKEQEPHRATQVGTQAQPAPHAAGPHKDDGPGRVHQDAKAVAPEGVVCLVPSRSAQDLAKEPQDASRRVADPPPVPNDPGSKVGNGQSAGAKAAAATAEQRVGAKPPLQPMAGSQGSQLQQPMVQPTDQQAIMNRAPPARQPSGSSGRQAGGGQPLNARVLFSPTIDPNDPWLQPIPLPQPGTRVLAPVGSFGSASSSDSDEPQWPQPTAAATGSVTAQGNQAGGAAARMPSPFAAIAAAGSGNLNSPTIAPGASHFQASSLAPSQQLPPPSPFAAAGAGAGAPGGSVASSNAGPPPSPFVQAAQRQAPPPSPFFQAALQPAAPAGAAPGGGAAAGAVQQQPQQQGPANNSTPLPSPFQSQLGQRNQDVQGANLSGGYSNSDLDMAGTLGQGDLGNRKSDVGSSHSFQPEGAWNPMMSSPAPHSSDSSGSGEAEGGAQEARDAARPPGLGRSSGGGGRQLTGEASSLEGPSQSVPSEAYDDAVGAHMLRADPEADSLMERPATLELHKLTKEIKALRWLGQGAGGVVFRGLWNDVPVAIKFMLSASADHMDEKFREAVLARYVSHPNVVQTFTYDRAYLSESIVRHARTHHGIIGGGQLSAESFGRSLNLFDEWGHPGGESGMLHMAHRMSNNNEPLSHAGGHTAGNVAAELLARGGGNNHNRGASTSGVGSQAGGMSGSGFGDPDGSLANMTGWSLPDVLVHMGAQPGQYMTHIVMELCDAGTLLKAIKLNTFSPEASSSSGPGSSTTGASGSGTPAPSPAAASAVSKGQYHMRALLRTAREVARGVAFLHSLNIIHGDLKPGNVLLKRSTEDKRGFIAKVSDFGLSRYLPKHSDSDVSVVEEPVGTPVYLAPEVVHSGIITKSSDIYSFGALLWQMVTGEVPFNGMRPEQVLYGKQQGTLVLQWPSSAYGPLRKLGELCLSPDPKARPTADQVSKALLKIEQHLHQKLKSSGSSGGSASKTSGPHPRPGSGGSQATTSGAGVPVAGSQPAAAAHSPGPGQGMPRISELPSSGAASTTSAS